MNLDEIRGLSLLIMLLSNVTQGSLPQEMGLGIPTVNQSVLEENQENIRIDANIFRFTTWEEISNFHGVYPQNYLYNTTSVLSRLSDEAKYQAVQGLSNTIQSLLLVFIDVMALRHGPIGSLLTMVGIAINTPIQMTRGLLGITGFASAQILGKAVKRVYPSLPNKGVYPITHLTKLRECRPMYIQKFKSTIHISKDKNYYLMTNGRDTMQYIANGNVCFSSGGSSDILGNHGSLYGQRMLMPFNTCVSYYIASNFIFEIIQNESRKDRCFTALNPLFIAEGKSKTNEVVIAEVNGLPFVNLKNTWIKEQEYQCVAYYGSAYYDLEGHEETWITVIPRAHTGCFTSCQMDESETILREECSINSNTFEKWNKSFPQSFRFKITKTDRQNLKIDLVGKGCTNFYFNEGLISPRLDIYTKDGTQINIQTDKEKEQVLIKLNQRNLQVTQENAKYIPGLLRPWLLAYFNKNKTGVDSDRWQIDIHNAFEESDFTGPIAKEVYRESVQNMIQEVKDYIVETAEI